MTTNSSEKARPVHFDKSGGYGEALCGYGAGSPDVKWTENAEKITCRNCQRVIEATAKKNLKSFNISLVSVSDEQK